MYIRTSTLKVLRLYILAELWHTNTGLCDPFTVFGNHNALFICGWETYFTKVKDYWSLQNGIKSGPTKAIYRFVLTKSTPHACLVHVDI